MDYDALSDEFGFPILLLSLFGLTVFGGVVSIKKLDESAKKRDREYQVVSSLVDKCNLKASGADSLFSNEEGVKLARNVGYSGSLHEGEKVRLSAIYGDAKLLIGYEGERFGEPIAREIRSVPKSALETYLKRE